MNALEFIAFVLIFGGALYFAWRDGFEQGVSAGNRRHVKQWSRLFRENRHLSGQVAGLDNRIDGIEARLAKVEDPNANVVYADGKPYTTVPDIESLHPDINPETTFDGYKFRCEPELDHICASCTHHGTSICFGCGFDHVFYDKITEKPEDRSCDTCVNDGDMSHLQCRYCEEGSCYIKKEGNHIIVKGELPDGAVDCVVERRPPDADTDSN